jgi:sulfur carrier protein ThiS adenylyltransferase
MLQTNPFELGLLRYLDSDQLALIRSKRIGIGGAGGLGSNVAVILVRTGFRNLEIIDKDSIDSSNLNRQDYTLDDLGAPKVEALRERLLRINPAIHIVIHQKEWSEKSDVGLFAGCHFIIEAFDDADWKYRFVEYYRTRFPHVVSGSGMAGLLNKSPLSVKKVGNVYVAGDLVTSTSDGHPPMAPRVIQCAAKMAEIVLDLTLGIPII